MRVLVKAMSFFCYFSGKYSYLPRETGAKTIITQLPAILFFFLFLNAIRYGSLFVKQLVCVTFLYVVANTYTKVVPSGPVSMKGRVFLVH